MVRRSFLRFLDSRRRRSAWIASLIILVLLTIDHGVAVAGPARPPAQARREIARLLEQTLPQFDIDPRRLPRRFRRQVINRVYAYTVLYRTDVQAMLERATPHLPMIKRILRQHRLPAYFAYIPLVESAFRPDARHPESGAGGLWQLMPTTARGFGLRVSDEVDERLDPQRATLAAARYLRRLQNRFGHKSPLHILAAYNHGDTNLARAMRRFRTRDIWHLYVHRRLPYQTRDYLIKMVTLWVVVARATDFALVEREAPASRVSALVPPPSTRLSRRLCPAPQVVSKETV